MTDASKWPRVCCHVCVATRLGPQVVSLLLTEILDGSHFFAHLATDETDALSSLQAKLAATRVGGSFSATPVAVRPSSSQDIGMRMRVGCGRVVEDACREAHTECC